MPTAFFVSGDEEIRTLDLLHAMQALYQLSYVPGLAVESMNPRSGPIS